MSNSIKLSTEITDPQTQFHNGIKMIISAYETQTSFLLNEISQLRENLKDKNTKLSKLESLCSSLLEDKTKYEHQLSSLSSTNNHLKQQISSLQSQLNNYSINHSSHFATKSSTRISNGTNMNEYVPFPKETIDTSYKNNFNEKRHFQYKRNANEHLHIKENDILTKTQNALLNKRNPIENNVIEGSYGYNDKYSIENGSCESGDDYNEEEGNSMEYGSKRKGNSDFFKLCRDALSVEEYSDIIDVIHLYNAHQIDKDETYEKIERILNNGNHINLLSEFELLFN